MEPESPAAQLFSQCIINFTAEPTTRSALASAPSSLFTACLHPHFALSFRIFSIISLFSHCVPMLRPYVIAHLVRFSSFYYALNPAQTSNSEITPRSSCVAECNILLWLVGDRHLSERRANTVSS